MQKLTAACATGLSQGSSGHMRDIVTLHAGIRRDLQRVHGDDPALHDSRVGLLCCISNPVPGALQKRQVGTLAVGL